MFSTIMDKIKKFMQIKRNKTIVTIGLIVVCFFVFNLGGLIGKVFTSITSIFSSDGEVKQVIFKSDGYDSEEDGSFKVVKQADWTSTNTAQIIYTVDSIIEKDSIKKDVIIVLDVSASMKGSKISSVQADLKELVNEVLSDEGNKFALITFSSDAKILSGLTDNKTTLMSLIDGIEPKGETNYNQALAQVGNILKDYTKSDDREVEVLFITDGYPTMEHPNQNATYTALKKSYPYITIHGIPYDMGETVPSIIEKISDYQYTLTSDSSSLGNILQQAVYAPEGYETFEIIEYVDSTYFTVGSNDIYVTIGEASVTTENGNQKITWTVPSGEYITGSTHQMKINLTLKSSYVKKEGLYPTSTKENIRVKLFGSNEITLTSTEVTKLKAPYKITYEANAPSGCSAKISLVETAYAYETVGYSATTLECEGYRFDGWEVVDKVTMINDDTFQMPTYDITVKGLWTKLDITKSMQGEVYERLTLYKAIENQAVADNIKSTYVSSTTGINFSSVSSNTNGKGVYTIASTLNNTYPIHYYRGNVTNNNVIFAGFCWKIIRTTETGGVKLMYNGPAVDNKCNNTGTSTQIGTSAYNSDNTLLTSAGYMLNTSNSIVNKSDDYWYTISYYGVESSGWYASSVSRSSYSQWPYYPSGVRLISIESENTDLESMKGLYWITGYSQYPSYPSGYSWSSVGYILEMNGTSAMYVIALHGGYMLSDYYFMVADSYTENSNGTYTLNNPIKVTHIDLYNNGFENYQGYYMCHVTPIIDSYFSNNSGAAFSHQTTCNNIMRLDTSSNKGFYYGSGPKTIRGTYSNSFTYSGSTYTLTNPISSFDAYDNKYLRTRYTCANSTGSCSTIYYTLLESTTQTIRVPLSSGQTIDDFVTNSLSSTSTNNSNSAIKSSVDTWYKNNLSSYSAYIEDTVFCNDRSISNKGTFNKSSSMNTPLTFNNSTTSSPSLSCTNSIDKFTVSTSIGNGKLTYPVGLITNDEVIYAGRTSTSYIKSGQNYWTMSPYQYTNTAQQFNIYVSTSGSMAYQNVNQAYGVRPVISLKPDIEYTRGNGTADFPYIIDISN